MFSQEGLLLAIDVLTSPDPDDLVLDLRGDETSHPHDPRLVEVINREAKKLSSGQGVFHGSHLLAAVKRSTDLADDTSVQPKLEALTWPIPLGDGWFTGSWGKRNPIESRAKKMAVLQPGISPASVRQGLVRDRHAYAPPTSVLQSFFRHHPEFILEDGRLSLVDSVDIGTVLTPIELEFKRVFDEHGPVLDISELSERCSDRGMSSSTVGMYLFKSPLVVRQG